MKNKSIISIISIMFLLITSLLVLSACGGDASYRVIKLFSYTGDCSIVRGSDEIVVEREGMTLKNNDELKVKANSNAILKLDNDKFICAKENTNIKLEATGGKNKTKTRLHVEDGGVIVEVKEKLKNGEKFEIASSNSVMAIRGTQISFDVEKTSTSITTTFSILTGNTEIFLYKDETMDSTTLIQEYMMSYTTSLIKTTDEIFKIYDSTKHKPISDEDLLNIYGVRKTPITSKKINEMVDVVNDFEKTENELVNGVIEFNMDLTVPYGTDPKTKINVLDMNKYTDIKDITYSYSTSPNGTYSEFNPDEPLLPGSYYAKLNAGNAYRSEPMAFTVSKRLINASMSSTVPLGVNPKDYITIEGTYENLRYLYMDPNVGVYMEYDESNKLPKGTYYAKVENDLYSTSPMEFRIVEGTLSISLKNDSITYGTNPNTNINVPSGYSNLKYYYSQNENSGFTLYNSSTVLSVGTWYVKVLSANNYTSNVLSFTVVPAKLNATLTTDNVAYGTNPNTIIDLNGFDKSVTYLYRENENDDFVEYDSSNPFNVGFYQVKVISGNEYISDILDFEITTKLITFTVGSSVAYGTDPKTIITLNGTYPTVTYKYSTSENGAYSEFDSSNPLAIGTYYVKLFINDNYYSNATQFNVTKRLIEYSISTPITYGDNIINKITVTGTYDDGIEYYYSNSQTFSSSNRLTSSTILNPGTWYIKLTSGDEYDSEIKSITIDPITINYSVGSQVQYGIDPRRIVTVSGTYANLTYTYSTSSTGTFREYSDNDRLNPGTWYIKLENGTGYTSAVKSFTVTKATIDFHIASNILYGEDLNDYIEVGYNVDIYTSTSENGTYTKYNSSNPLAVGDYYIYLENDYYKSGKQQFSIYNVLDIMLPINIEQVFVNDKATIKVSIDDNDFFASAFAQEKIGDLCTYYINVICNYGRGGEHLDYRLDYDNRFFIYGGDITDITIVYEFNLPDVFNVLNDTEYEFEFENVAVLSNPAIDKDGNVYARLDEVGVSIYYAVVTAYYKFDNGTETSIVLSSERELGQYSNNTSELKFNVGSLNGHNTLTVRYEYTYDGLDYTYETTTYTFYLSNLVNTTDYSISPSIDNSFVTYTNYGTMNIYYDLGFTNNTDYNLACEVIYSTYREYDTNYTFSSPNHQTVTGRYLVCEDLPLITSSSYNGYAIYDYRIVNYVNGVCYILSKLSDDEDYEPSDAYSMYWNRTIVSASFDYDSYDGFELQGNSNYILDETDIKLYVYEYDSAEDAWKLNLKITFDEFKSTGWSDPVFYSTDGDEYLDIYAEYTAVTVLTNSFASTLFGTSYKDNLKIGSDALFHQLQQLMYSEYHVNVTGTYSLKIFRSYSFDASGD